MVPHLFYISEEQVGVDSQINIYFFGCRLGWILWVDFFFWGGGGLEFLINKFLNNSDHFLGLAKHRKSILRINSQNKLIKHRLHTTLQGFLMGWSKCFFSTNLFPCFSFLGRGWRWGCCRVNSYIAPSWLMHVSYKHGHPTITLYTARNQ